MKNIIKTNLNSLWIISILLVSLSNMQCHVEKSAMAVVTSDSINIDSMQLTTVSVDTAALAASNLDTTVRPVLIPCVLTDYLASDSVNVDTTTSTFTDNSASVVTSIQIPMIPLLASGSKRVPTGKLQQGSFGKNDLPLSIPLNWLEVAENHLLLVTPTIEGEIQVQVNETSNEITNYRIPHGTLMIK